MDSPDRDPDHALPPTPAAFLRGEPPTDQLGVATGLERLTREDLRLPQLKLKQPSSPFGAGVPDGSWFLTTDPEAHALSRGLVLLEARKERALILPAWGGPELVQAACQRIRDETGVEVPPNWEGPVCYSRDRVRPVEREAIPPLAAECATCPMTRWRTVEGRRVQDCRESYRLLFWDMGADLPCVFFARGAAMRATRELLTNLQVACHREELPALAFLFGLSSQRMEGVDGPYYVPVFSRPYPTSRPEEVPRYAAIRRACLALDAEED